MSNQQWKAKWRRNDIAFHQDAVNPLLQQFWEELELPEGSVVLVPLCGKSLDMGWLATLGFRVMGIELSDIAVQDYFAALDVVPIRARHGRFAKWKHGNTEIWRGDLFDLTAQDLSEVRGLYDCAALTALPADIRIRYVEHITKVLPPGCQMLLMTTESPDDTQADSALEIDEEVAALYSAGYTVELLYGKARIKIDPEYPDEPAASFDEKVYRIRPRPVQDAA
ncbi:thiopurine S-methyltransferase [Stutzerimonas tarimensis]|uniref:Thiopurine S-methyltransferase n=1 Tax=Stutzerimonas tarimensis TaxID=1507735 RepID=A0ABV7T1Y8_9GAMM